MKGREEHLYVKGLRDAVQTGPSREPAREAQNETDPTRRKLWRVDLNDVEVQDEHGNAYEVTLTRGVLNGTLTVTVEPRKPTWYDLNKAAGLTLDDTAGDGCGRYTEADKSKILTALRERADRIEGGWHA